MSQSYKQMSRKKSVGLARGPGSNAHWVKHVLLAFFCFHIVKPLMPMLGVSKNLYYFYSDHIKLVYIFCLWNWMTSCPLVTFAFHLTKSHAETKMSQGVFHQHNHLIHLIETIPIDVIHESTPQRFFAKQFQFVSLDVSCASLGAEKLNPEFISFLSKINPHLLWLLHYL